MWRTTHGAVAVKHSCIISIHVLHVEDDKYRRAASIPSRHFNPRPPCGGRLFSANILIRVVRFQSTSSVWRTTTQPRHRCTLCAISIHVLRVEDDTIKNIDKISMLISIHVLRVEDDVPQSRRQRFAPISIHVLRVEDDAEQLQPAAHAHAISIHVLRVEDDPVPCGRGPAHSPISIHVLRVEDDLISWALKSSDEIFQSTSSMWRTTDAASLPEGSTAISIHVLHVEDDIGPNFYLPYQVNFNPRPPCGGRPPW